jgi:hypothetical protein
MMRRAFSDGDSALLAVLIILGDGLKAGGVGSMGSTESMESM